MKLETVPCIRLTHLSDAQRRAYILADNRIAMNSGWDMEMLANELSDLHADEIDLGLMGFEVDELETLLGIESSDDESTNENNGLQVGNIEYRVVTQVASEAAQAALIDELEKRGFTCQPLMS